MNFPTYKAHCPYDGTRLSISWYGGELDEYCCKQCGWEPTDQDAAELIDAQRMLMEELVS